MAQQYTLQTEDSSSSPPQDQMEEKPVFSKQTLRLLIGGGILLVIFSFLGGFLIRGLFSSPQAPQIQPIASQPTPLATPVAESPTPSAFSEIPSSSIQFLPGKQYFEDTYVVITKKQPYKTLILTVARIEQERNYAQYTKVNFFDGEKWNRKAVTTTTTNSTVVTNPLLPGWKTTKTGNTEPSLAMIEIEDKEVSFHSSNLQNEISVESVPGSTKFIYQGEGSITITDEVHEAYVLHTRSYSFNAIDLAFFNIPENLNSNFVSFWDEDGEFYYVDTHATKNPTTPIQTRSVGIKENTRGVVFRTENIIPSFQQKDGINEFIVRLDAPIGEQLRLIFYRTLNKAESSTYTWTLSNVTGNSVKAEGRTVKGVGVIEYIRPSQ